jgi:hypothetical protein
MFSRFMARARSAFTIAESVERLGVMPPAPGVARSAFKPLGQQGSRIFGFLSPQGRIDQHFLEQIALRMAAADAPDFIPHGHKLADRTAMVAAAAS